MSALNEFREVFKEVLKNDKAGDRLKSFRVNRGLKITELSFITGISEANISNYENNHKTFSYKIAKKFSVALGCPISFLFVESKKEKEEKVKIQERFEFILKQREA